MAPTLQTSLLELAVAQLYELSSTTGIACLPYNIEEAYPSRWHIFGEHEHLLELVSQPSGSFGLQLLMSMRHTVVRRTIVWGNGNSVVLTGEEFSPGATWFTCEALWVASQGYPSHTPVRFSIDR